MPRRSLPVSPQSTANCTTLLNDLLEIEPSEFEKQDIALLNLLCAPTLPGSETLGIPRCLARLDELAASIRASTERNMHRFPNDPDWGHSEPMWRMALLVTVVKFHFGAAYDPKVKADLDRSGYSHFTDSRNAFIHGLLSDDPKRRWGSCSSIPVLVTAVARRLGYPVRLAVNRRHVYARWDDGCGVSFNVEASNPAGMAAPDDDHYRKMYLPPTAKEQRSDMYFRSLSPAEEFALFLKTRVWSLRDAARYAETLLWSARALQFSPDDPHFPDSAYEAADTAIKHRYRQKYPDRPIPPPERNEEFFFNLGEFLRIEERSLFLTIAAHHAEANGELDKARQCYVDSARQNFHGNNEQRDLQRFLRKHGVERKRGSLLLPKNIGQPRRIKLSCPPEKEADQLRRLVDQFEREGELIKARDTLHDLYLFNPCDADVFRRARTIERQPRFQTQLKTLITERRQAMRKTEQLKFKLTNNPGRRI
ncbi:MAG TPA: hypothetical protein VHD56_17100 [Tepidisphaeraceae bacterium]|nr:hypothetical protein [Tepidisphaeraceae bacterium]